MGEAHSERSEPTLQRAERVIDNIVNTLADLEVKEYLGATHTRAVGGKDISDQRILH